MRHAFAWIIPIICTLASCTAREAGVSASGEDSLALHVAVLPTMDCLPAYYAGRMGMFDSLGVDVRLMTFASQMDIDTALVRGHVQMGHENLARMEMMERKGVDTLTAVAELHEQLFLLTARARRIKTLVQLKGRMVAVDRFDNADYWSDILMEMAGLEQTDIYRPQVNDLQVRRQMLTSQLVDAALLPEPYATEARVMGHQQVMKTPDSIAGFNCFATTRQTEGDSALSRKVRLFLDAYRLAAKELRHPNADTLRAILSAQYGMTDEMIDTFCLPKIKQPTEPTEENRQRAAEWVTKRLESQR